MHRDRSLSLPINDLVLDLNEVTRTLLGELNLHYLAGLARYVTGPLGRWWHHVSVAFFIILFRPIKSDTA